MPDVPNPPSSAPHKAAKGGLQSLGKMPPWAILAIAGVGIVIAGLALRSRKQAQQDAAATDSTQSADGSNSADPNYTVPVDSGGLGLPQAQGPISYSGDLFGIGNPNTLPPAQAAQGAPSPPISIVLGGDGGSQGVVTSTAAADTGGGPPSRPNPSSTVHLAKGVKPVHGPAVPGAAAVYHTPGGQTHYGYLGPGGGFHPYPKPAKPKPKPKRRR